MFEFLQRKSSWLSRSFLYFASVISTLLRPAHRVLCRWYTMWCCLWILMPITMILWAFATMKYLLSRLRSKEQCWFHVDSDAGLFLNGWKKRSIVGQQATIPYFELKSPLLYSSRSRKLVMIVASPVQNAPSSKLLQIPTAIRSEHPHSRLVYLDWRYFGKGQQYWHPMLAYETLATSEYWQCMMNHWVLFLDHLLATKASDESILIYPLDEWALLLPMYCSFLEQSELPPVLSSDTDKGNIPLLMPPIPVTSLYEWAAQSISNIALPCVYSHLCFISCSQPFSSYFVKSLGSLIFKHEPCVRLPNPNDWHENTALWYRAFATVSWAPKYALVESSPSFCALVQEQIMLWKKMLFTLFNPIPTANLSAHKQILCQFSLEQQRNEEKS